jgi:hypothetical protein
LGIGDQPDPLLAFEIRKATEESKPALRELCDAVFENRLPKWAPEQATLAPRKYFKGSRDPMYIYAAEKSRDRGWEQDNDPLAWISREARKLNDARLYADATDHWNRERIAAIDIVDDPRVSTVV